MKKILILSLLISIGSITSGIAQPADHVVIITIDGFRSDFYLDDSWGMVNLRQLKEEGVHAKGVNSIFPSSTFPNHTSIVTGVRPAKHGIYYNNQFKPDRSGEWYWYYKSIEAPTLWDVVHKAGRTSAAVNWPVAVGAPVDFNIPIIKESGSSRINAIKKHTTPDGLFEEVEQNATGILENLDFSMQGDYLLLDQNLARITAYLIREYKPTLTTVRLSLTDHFEHKQGRDGDKVRRVIAGVDRSLKTILDGIERAGIKDNTAVIVTGDHGFVNRHTLLAPNVWLKRAGLTANKNNGNWKAQFHTAGGSAFLQLQDPNDQQTLDKVKSVIKDLPKSQQQLFRVINKDELRDLDIDPDVSLALTANKGIGFSSSFDGSMVRSTSGGTHGYLSEFPEIQTGFVGYGAGFKQGTALQTMNIEDIAPVVAELLGLELVTADGIAYPALLD